MTETVKNLDNSNSLEVTNYWGRVLENSFDEIYVFDAETLRFIQVSKGALQNLGYCMLEMRDLMAVDIKLELSQVDFDRLILIF